MIDIQTKKAIRGLMQDPRWNSLEVAFHDYLKEQFINVSPKGINEFETIWNVAYKEGGKYYLLDFINRLENYSNYD